MEKNAHLPTRDDRDATARPTSRGWRLFPLSNRGRIVLLVLGLLCIVLDPKAGLRYSRISHMIWPPSVEDRAATILKENPLIG
jgi:hypothetical protein